MDKTDQSELEIEELLRDPDRDAFWRAWITIRTSGVDTTGVG